MIEDRRELAERIVQLAWLDLPLYDRELLESIGASQWAVTSAALGTVVEDLLRSAGSPCLPPGGATVLDRAAGVWIAELRLVLINASHPALAELEDGSYEQMVARVAWHEWAHALSEYTHELVAEIYAILMSRRRRGQSGQPGWLHDEIYELVRRVSGWSE